jgi:hypothetical protein
MEIRIRETGEIVSEREFRRLHSTTSFPALTPTLLDAYGADPVLNGPQAQNLLWWQHSQRDGVEQINGKWYTKHIAGPVFATDEDRDAYIAQREVEAAIAAQEALKLSGVEILGVMCSATKEDQSGLSAVALGVTIARANGQTFPATRFEFQNGNSLVITDANFNQIYGAWVPFRQSFFAAGIN